ncbi:MAG: Ig-like domain-containing protein [Bacteroidales bacterium]|jgi:hypothetical protein
MKGFFQKYWFCFFILFIGACANIVSPSGGPVDKTPPKVIKTIPEINSKNFKGKSIRIEFDKFIKLNDVSNQLIVSPYMKDLPDLKIRRKSILVEFKDTLKSNITYSLSFGKSISDNTENNVLNNYRFVFSTGNTIDSLTLKGVVKNSFSLKPESDAAVMLYKSNYDSVPYKELPYYITKTDENGAFAFTNIRNDSYKIFVLTSKTGDYHYMPGEKIAFLDSLVTPLAIDTIKADSIKNNFAYKLFLFEEEPSQQKMLKASATRYGKLVIIFRKPVENLSLIPLAQNIPADWNLLDENKTKDTITVWLKNPDMDSLTLQISDNHIILDTAKLTLAKKSTGKTRGKKAEDTKHIGLRANASTNSTFDFFKTLLINASTPISDYYFNKIILTENKDTIKPIFSFNDSIRRIICVNYKWKEETNYTLFIPPGTFKDMFEALNDTLKLSFKTTATKNYGNIKLKLNAAKIGHNLIVQLVTDDGDMVVQEKVLSSVEIINFLDVNPGNYKIRIIYDANNNKKWDTGNYLKKTQPEKVIYYPSPISLKANWDLDLDWEFLK